MTRYVGLASACANWATGLSRLDDWMRIHAGLREFKRNPRRCKSEFLRVQRRRAADRLQPLRIRVRAVGSLSLPYSQVGLSPRDPGCGNMKCKFCFFDDVVLPTRVHPLVGLIRPFFRIAVCENCATETLVRGPLLLGPPVPRETDVVASRDELPYLEPRRTHIPLDTAQPLPPTQIVRHGTGRMLKRSAQPCQKQNGRVRYDSVSLGIQGPRVAGRARRVGGAHRSIKISSSGKFQVRSPGPNGESETP